MRILTDGFVEGWAGRMINIHPSLLPLFKGTHTHAQALAAGVRLHGCTVHFVVPELDAGPIVAQAAVPVREGDDPDSLAARVIVQERRLYPAALALVAGGKARWKATASSSAKHRPRLCCSACSPPRRRHCERQRSNDGGRDGGT